MKKSELKTGDQLTFRNGQTTIVLLRTRNGDICSCIGADGGVCGDLSSINEDLTHKHNYNYDVVKVSKAETNMRYLYNYETIWEREEKPEYVECVYSFESYSTHSKAEIYGCTNYARKECENGVVYKVVKECLINESTIGYVLENNGEHYLISKNGVKPSTKQAYEAQVPEYVELLCNLCGYKKGDVAKVVRSARNGYKVFAPNRKSTSGYKPYVWYWKEDTKPSTKEAYEAQTPEYTVEQLTEMIGHNFKIKK